MGDDTNAMRLYPISANRVVMLNAVSKFDTPTAISMARGGDLADFDDRNAVGAQKSDRARTLHEA